MKAMESDLALLRQQLSRNEVLSVELQQQLVQRDKESFSATVVYVLLGLLALALSLLAWLWMKRPTQAKVQAWHDSMALDTRDAIATHKELLNGVEDPADSWIYPSVPPDTAPMPVAPVAVAAPDSPWTVVKQVSMPLEPSTPVVPSKPEVQAEPHIPVPQAPAQTAPHLIHPEELFDVLQQAEFFISVGEHQQAIDVLRTHIDEYAEATPFAYLELLRLYHTLSHPDEFEALRAQFMQTFNAQVPVFAHFHRSGRMLYHYTEALAEIEAQWTSPSVLELLEKMAFRKPGAVSSQAFDLAAYDDLLLLLAIAQTTQPSSRGEPSPRKRTTPLLPSEEDAGEAYEPREPELSPAAIAPEVPLESLSMGLEFTLDDSLPAWDRSATKAVASGVGERGPMAVLPDIDLSQPLDAMFRDLPEVPAPSQSKQFVGFGSDNDQLELRRELEQKMKAEKSDR